MAKNIGATLSLKNGNFFTGIRSASSAAEGLKSKLSGASAGVKSFTSTANKSSGITSKLVKGIAGITAAAISLNSAVNFGKSVIELGSSYQDSMAKVSTIADTSVKSVSELSSEVLSLSSKTGTAASDINEALYQAISAGADTAKATELVGVAVKAAKGGFTDTTTAVDGLTSVLNTYGMATSEAQSLANMFLITQNKGKTSFGELATTIGQVAPVAKSTGVGINELLSGVASLTANGLSTSSAMTGLKAALSNIIKPTADAQKMAKSLGIDFSTSALQAQGLSSFMKTLADKTGGNTDKMAKLFGSVEGLNAMLTLTSSGGLSLMNSTMQEMKTNTTALDDAYSAMTGTVTAQVDILKNKISNMKINIFERLDGTRFVSIIEEASSRIDEFTPVIADAAVVVGDVLLNAVNVLSAAVKTGGNIIKGVIDHWKIFAVIISPVVLAIGAYKSAVAICNTHDRIKNGLMVVANALTGTSKRKLGELTIAQLVHTSAVAAGQKAIGLMTGAQKLLNAAFVSSPIGWIVLGIGALVTVFAVLWNKCEGFRNFWKGLWGGIKNVCSSAMSAVKETISEKLSNIKSAYEEHGGGIKGVAFAAMEGIKGYYTAGFTFVDKLTGGKLTSVVNSVKEKMQEAKDAAAEKLKDIKSSYEEHGGGIKGAAYIAMQGVKNYYAAGFTALNKLTGGKLSSMAGSVMQKFRDVKNGITGIFDGIANGIKGCINKVISGINSMIRGINKIKFSPPDWVPAIGGKRFGFDIPTIPMLAKGGSITSSGSVLVGEKGPELLNLPRGASVVPLGKRTANETFIRNGGNTVNVKVDVNINADNRPVEELADEIINIFIPKVKRIMANI